MATLSAAPATGFATTECRYVVTASDLVPASYNVGHLKRISSHYGTEFVETNIEIDDTSATINDYAFHFADKDSLTETSHTYELDLYMGDTFVDTLTSASVTPHTDRANDSNFTGVTSPSSWIKKLDAATLGAFPITVAAFDGYNRTANVLTEYRVLGTNTPFIVTDGTSGMSGTMSILVYDDPTWGINLVQLDELLAEAEIMFFQTTWPYLSGIQDFFFVAREYSVSRLTRVVPLALGASAPIAPMFQVDIEFVEQQRPADQDNVAPLTWGTLEQNYDDWAAMSSANASWLDVLLDG